jgi:hypothetical protein
VRSIWKVIRNCVPSKIKPNACYSKNPSELCEEFNDHFVSVGERTAKSAQELAKDYNLMLLNPSFKENSVRPLSQSDDTPGTLFSFQPLTSADIDRVIVNMPANKAPGFDKISIHVLKNCYPYISQTVAGLIHSSFHQEVFPVAWKKAEVMSHLKDGDHEIAGNNRPISLLPVLSKTCERVALEQFSSYLNESEKLSIHQSGNQKNHSTETLQIYTLDRIGQAIDNKCVTVVLSAINWFRSYLTDRYQFVRIGECQSE